MKYSVLIPLLFLLGCTPSQGSNQANEQKAEDKFLTDGTSSGGGSCSIELSCRFSDAIQTSLGVVAACGTLELMKLKDDQWISESSPIEAHRWTIYRENNEYVLLFKRKLASPEDQTPWVQLEVKLEQKFHDGPNKNSYPALLSGGFVGLNQNFKNEPMICQPGWFK